MISHLMKGSSLQHRYNTDFNVEDSSPIQNSIYHITAKFQQTLRLKQST